MDDKPSLSHKVLPNRLDNNYRGYQLALWIFAVIALMKLAMGSVHIFNPTGGAQSVSHMPLETYPMGAVQNVVAVFARMGLEQQLLGVVFVIVLVRYRAMIPLMYAVAVIGNVGVLALGTFKPLSTATPSGARPLHLVLAGLSIVGLVLSLLGSGYAKTTHEVREKPA